jgi:23S rRNA (adenine2503-C2)-methyltransferase
VKEQNDLKSLTYDKLVEWFADNDLQTFRAKQVFNWIYKNGVNDFSGMENIPESLEEKLEDRAELSEIHLQKKSEASDGTTKYLWYLEDGEYIESVYLPYFNHQRYTVCISTQIGCEMGCKFCATGIDGLKRNLTVGEIVNQVLRIQQDISKDNFGEPAITNIVFMGMGEPMANLPRVLDAAEIFNHDKGLNIGMRKMTISSSGIVPGIKKLAEKNNQIGLAISLHAPNDSLRSRIMPVNRDYPIDELMEAVEYYTDTTNRRVTFEYVLMKNLNDAEVNALQLSELLQGVLCHVNLIPANPVSELGIERPDFRTVNRFEEILNNHGIETTVRQERGIDIEAACGQLRRKK